MSEKAKDAAKRITDELAAAEIKLVASLPDDWIAELIKTLEVDKRFIHAPVNREESAVGLCSGSFFSGTRSVALMGASGLMTCVYAITKINYFTHNVFIRAVLTHTEYDESKWKKDCGCEYF